MNFVPKADVLNKLNKDAIRISGKELTFQIYYWGTQFGEVKHKIHKHSFIEVCYIIGGKGIYLDNNEKYPFGSGSLICSRPNILHQIQCSDITQLFVGFEIVEKDSQSLYVEKFKELKTTDRCLIDNAHQTTTSKLWKILWEQSSDVTLFSNTITVNLAYSLLMSFFDAFLDREEPKEHAEDRHQEIPLYQAKLFIRDNISQSLRIEDVANYLHISKRHLSRLFKAKLGMAFSTFVKNERIKMSSYLLKHTDKSIKQVANETGFVTVHYFTKVFTDEKGITPARYRLEG